MKYQEIKWIQFSWFVTLFNRPADWLKREDYNTRRENSMPEVLRLGFSIILSYKNHKIIHYNLSWLPGREKCKVLSAGLKISKSKERN